MITRKTMQTIFVQPRYKRESFGLTLWSLWSTLKNYFFSFPSLRDIFWLFCWRWLGNSWHQFQRPPELLCTLNTLSTLKWQPIPFLPKNIPWAEEPGELWSMEPRDRYNWAQTYLAITLHPVLWMKEGIGHQNILYPGIFAVNTGYLVIVS